MRGKEITRIVQKLTWKRMPSEMQALAVERSTREPPTGMGPMARIMPRYLKKRSCQHSQRAILDKSQDTLLLSFVLLAGKLLLEVVSNVGQLGRIDAVFEGMAVVEVFEELRNSELGGLETWEGDNPAETKEEDLEHDAQRSNGEGWQKLLRWVFTLHQGYSSIRTFFGDEDDTLLVRVNVVQTLSTQSTRGAAVDLDCSFSQVWSQLANLAVEEAVCSDVAPVNEPHK